MYDKLKENSRRMLVLLVISVLFIDNICKKMEF